MFLTIFEQIGNKYGTPLLFLEPEYLGKLSYWSNFIVGLSYERSIKRLNEYDDLTPNQPDFCWGEHINFLKGLCYKQMGDYGNSIKEFNTLIEYEGEYVDVYGYVYRGISYMNLEQYSDAISDFDLAIKQYDKCAMAYFYKGFCYEKLGNLKLAKEQYYTAQTLIEHGYLQVEPYYEMFDEISGEMVADQLDSIQ